MNIISHISSAWLQEAAVKQGVPTESIQQALGRYVLYGTISNWPIAEIYQDGPTDMVAVYHGPVGGSFTLGAVWRPEEGKFTFHS